MHGRGLLNGTWQACGDNHNFRIYSGLKKTKTFIESPETPTPVFVNIFIEKRD